jgi:hypothetical protein
VELVHVGKLDTGLAIGDLTVEVGFGTLRKKEKKLEIG